MWHLPARTGFKPVTASTVGGILHDSNPPSGANPDAFPPHAEYYPAIENYFEILGEEDIGERWAWKGCSHYKRTVNQPNIPVQQHGYNDYSQPLGAWWEFYGVPPSNLFNGLPGWTQMAASDLGTMDLPLEGLPLLYEENLAGRSVLPQVALRPYIDRSVAAMMPGIKGGFSLINSVLELKDIRSVPRTIDAISGAISSLGGRIAPRTLWRRAPLRYLIKAPADVYLQIYFNVLPMLSDISKAVRAMKSVPEQCKRLAEGADKPLRRKFSCALTENHGVGSTVQTIAGNTENPYYIGGVRYERITSVNLSRFCATMEYSYKLPSMSDAAMRARGYADFFGVNLNPSIIWNAIPWTFVVDWVIGVSRWLDQFTLHNIEPLVYIRRYCCSLHVERSSLVYMRGNWNSTHEGSDVLTTQVVEEAYKRIVKVPDLYSSIVLSGLSPKEFSLSAALALSRST